MIMKSRIALVCVILFLIIEQNQDFKESILL